MKKWQQAAILLIICTGIILRLWWFYDARSLFLDEANLALNIAELNYADFFVPLKYQQYAPPFFVVIVKACTSLFGMNEWALRLPSLVFAIISIGLFYQLLRLLLDNRWALIYPLALFAFSGFLVRYSTELKQYSLDVTITLLLIYMALKLPVQRLQIKHWMIWAATGCLMVWLSMPSVFVLFSVGIYYSWKLLKDKDFKKLGILAGISLCWLASFALIYYQVLLPSLGEEHLINFHLPYFFPANPFSAAGATQAWTIFRGLIAPVVGYTALALILGIFFLLWGIYRFSRKQQGYVLLIGLPILIAFIASALGQFSLLPRVSLFIMPLLLLFIGKGAEALFSLIPSAWQSVLLLVLLIISEPVLQSITTIGQSTEIEDAKSAISWAATKEGKTFIHHEAMPAYRFYSECHDQHAQYELDAVIISWDMNLSQALQQHPSPAFMLLNSHVISDYARGYTQAWVQEAQSVGVLKETEVFEGAVVHYFIKE